MTPRPSNEKPSDSERSSSSPVSSIVIITAIESQALSLVKRLRLKGDDTSLFPGGVPWIRYHGTYKDLCINLIWPGKDLALGVDSIGTVSASLVVYASVQALKPDLIINAGTAGGFKSKGAGVGDVFIASHVAFHDRRNPLPVRDLYCIGLRQAFSTPTLLKELNLKAAKLSTGNSLDICPQDQMFITANDATLKDMEGAAVAYVGDLLKSPVIFLKAVTYIVDEIKPTEEQYVQNLTAGSNALDDVVAQTLEFINGKSLSQL